MWIYTYEYLSKLDSENNFTYDSAWQMLDPCGYGKNPELKLYVQSLIKNRIIVDFAKEKFGNFKTTDNDTIGNFNAVIDRKVDEYMDSYFEIGFQKLDGNLQQYIKTVIRSYLLSNNHQSINNSDNFIINIQRTLEAILKIDKENRHSIYETVCGNFQDPYRNDLRSDESYSHERRRRIWAFIEQGKIIVSNPKATIIYIASKIRPGNAHSLKQYMLPLLLSYDSNRENLLFDILADKIDVIFEIANLRNSNGSHGQTTTEGKIKTIPKDVVDRLFEELKQIVNKYIQ